MYMRAGKGKERETERERDEHAGTPCTSDGDEIRKFSGRISVHLCFVTLGRIVK